MNSGIGRAAGALRRLVGISGDGPLESGAFLAAVRKAGARDLVVRLCDERLSFLKRLKTWPVFGAGWGRRVAEVRSAALAMTDTPQPSAAAHGAAAGGVATAGAVVAQQAHHAGTHPLIVAAVVFATAALLVCLWLAWRWRRRRNAS